MPTAYKYPSRLHVLGIQNRNNISSLSFMRTAAIEIGISSKESQRMLIIEFENKHNNRTKTRTTTTTKKKHTQLCCYCWEIFLKFQARVIICNNFLCFAYQLGVCVRCVCVRCVCVLGVEYFMKYFVARIAISSKSYRSCQQTHANCRK